MGKEGATLGRLPSLQAASPVDGAGTIQSVRAGSAALARSGEQDAGATKDARQTIRVSAPTLVVIEI